MSLSETARRTGVSKAALVSWESGTHQPRGPALARLLDVLGTESRVRADVLYGSAPFLQNDLGVCTIGQPVHIGQVIRAMRERRGETQTSLSRRLGVAQSTAARWEAGETVADTHLVDRVCAAFQALPEEHAALLSVAGLASRAMPNDVGEAQSYVDVSLSVARELYEVVSLGLEAELWRRSARDARWDPLHLRVIAERANTFFCEGRLGEVEALARRALRQASTPETRIGATAAVGALVALAKHRKEPASLIAIRLSSWIEGLPSSLAKSWMIWERALRLAVIGKDQEAIAETERSIEMLVRSAPAVPADELDYHRLKKLTETYVQADRAEEALALWPMNVSPLARMIEIAARHASAAPAPEAHMEQVRAFVHAPETGYWIYRQRLVKIERDQARLAPR